MTFLQRGEPMVLVQKWPFFKLYFFGNIGQENVFYDILERKKAFLVYKIKKFKKSKNWNFFKRVNPWFCSKNGHFLQFLFLGDIGQKNVFYDILERENAFLSIKSRSSKCRKIDIFANGLIYGFGLKMAIFCTFFF